MPKRKTTEHRFMEKVWYDPKTGCLLWMGCQDGRGYGAFNSGRKPWRAEKAYRVAFRLSGATVPNGLQLDHLCRVRHCVNPEHLEPVTSRENTLRGVGPCARHARKTHCVNGHRLGGSNVFPFSAKRGWRLCRVCHNTRQRNRHRHEVARKRYAEGIL